MTFKFLTHLFFVSFLLNFLWEITQMVAFSGEGMGQIADFNLFVRTHWLVSLKDAGMIIILYALIAIILRNWHWGRHFSRKRLLPLWFLGVAWAIGIEYYHTQLHHDWAYNSAMPLIPFLMIGLWPVLQMLVLPMFAIWLSRKSLFV